MSLKAVSLISILFLFISFETLSQVDTTIVISLNKNTEMKERKNVVSTSLFYTMANFIFDDASYAYGASYERLLKNGRSLSLTYKRAKNAGYPYNNIIYTVFVEHRFYMTHKKVSSFRAGGKKHTVKVREHQPKIPHGFYIGALAMLQKETLKPERNSEENSWLETGIGVSIGYQFLIRNRYTLNISVPMAVNYGKGNRFFFDDIQTYTGFEANVGFSF